MTVLLKDRNVYFGALIGYSQHMSIVLEEALNGDIVPGDIELEQIRDTTIIRGDNAATIRA